MANQNWIVKYVNYKQQQNISLLYLFFSSPLIFILYLLPFPSHLVVLSSTSFPYTFYFILFQYLFSSHLLFFSIIPLSPSLPLFFLFISSSDNCNFLFASPLIIFPLFPSNFVTSWSYLAHLSLNSLSLSPPLYSFSYGSFLVYQHTCFWLNQ